MPLTDHTSASVEAGEGLSPLAATPSVDVIVPAYNEARHIAACIEGVLAQDYPADRLRLILVDAGSSDATVEIAEGFARRDGRIVVVSGRGRLTTPAALNVGLEVCTADVFARVDAHGGPAGDYVSRAVDALRAGGPDIAGVGGQPSFSGDSDFGRAFTLARGSKLGVGGSVYAAAARRQVVDTVPWGIYRREALERVGGFDPSMNHGEDEELNWRLKGAGLRVMLDPAIRFEYVPRSSWWAAFSQYRNYGRARVRVVRAHPDFLRLRHLAPAVLVLGAVAAVAAAPFSSTGRVVLGAGAILYAAAASVAAVRATGRRRLRLAPLVALCFPALHFGYGVGTLGEALSVAARAVSSRNRSLSSRQ